METYEFVRRRSAVKDTTNVWNLHRIWATLGVPSIALFVAVLKYMFGAAPSVTGAVFAGIIAAIGSLVILWTGSFFLNYIWLTPSALHKGQQDTIGSLKSGIADQDKAQQNVVGLLKSTIANQEQLLAAKEEAFRRKHGVDEDRENYVATMLSDFNAHEVKVLRILLRNGEMSEGTLPTVEDRRAITKGKGCSLVKERVERTAGGNYTYFAINPSFENALKNVFHPPLAP